MGRGKLPGHGASAPNRTSGRLVPHYGRRERTAFHLPIGARSGAFPRTNGRDDAAVCRALACLRFDGQPLHLLLELRESNLSRAIQWLNVSYSIWFNLRHRRSGHLFQGRFKSVIVSPEEWGLGLSRYVHLNPVRVAKLGLGKAEREAQRQEGRWGSAGISP